jgi:hypothetical protein
MSFDIQNAKSIFSSTTFWGSIVSLLALLAPHVYTNLAGNASQTVVVSTIVGVVGFLVTVYGRFTAKQVVTLAGGPVSSSPSVPLVNKPASGSKG